MHWGVVDVLGTCCIYFRGSHRPWSIGYEVTGVHMLRYICIAG
jgi:hypothetical protein